MATENQPTQEPQAPDTPQAGEHQPGGDIAQKAKEAFDGLADKKPEELTPEELRLMADTMPGEGPGD